MCLKETLTLKIFVKPFPCTLFSRYSQNKSFTLTVAINITFRFTLVIPTGTSHPNPYLLLYVDILTLTINLILTLGNLNFNHCCQFYRPRFEYHRWIIILSLLFVIFSFFNFLGKFLK